MAGLVVGDVVAVRFPFSDLTDAKRRPALVLAQVEFDNVILCQITSKMYTSQRAITLSRRDFASGNLPVTSYVRPDKLFTAEPSLIEHWVGALKPPVRKRVLAAVRKLFSAQ